MLGNLVHQVDPRQGSQGMNGRYRTARLIFVDDWPKKRLEVNMWTDTGRLQPRSSKTVSCEFRSLVEALAAHVYK